MSGSSRPCGPNCQRGIHVAMTFLTPREHQVAARVAVRGYRCDSRLTEVTVLHGREDGDEKGDEGRGNDGRERKYNLTSSTASTSLPFFALSLPLFAVSWNRSRVNFRSLHEETPRN